MTLSFGAAAALYEEAQGEKKTNQLTLLEKWLPGLVVTVEPAFEAKREAYFDDIDLHFHAVRYHGKLYQSAGSRRVAQILGRLTGTAKGSPEKERRTANRIQRSIASYLTAEKEPILLLQRNAMDQLEELNEAEADGLLEEMTGMILTLAEDRESMTAAEKNDEPFPMDDDIFDTVVTNALSELVTDGTQHLANAFLWLLLGGLLRNESWRLTHAFDPSFTMIHFHPGETASLSDRLHYILCPEDYYPVYSGDDLGARFPGVVWKCDRCGVTLNDQPGFDDREPVWKCKSCGYENRIAMDQIFTTEDDFQSGREPVNPEDFLAAVRARKEETGNKDKASSGIKKNRDRESQKDK